MIQPEGDGARPFSYPRLAQPVLDKHCVACHAKNAGKAPDLRGKEGVNFGATRDPQGRSLWYPSYNSLAPRGYGIPEHESNTTPGQFGARVSGLLQQFDKGHHDVKLPPEDLRRLTLWMDINSDFYGAFDKLEAQARGEVVWPKLE